ncbi:hypothetical protein J1605_010278 [Eschrichtius robustus]|uniref:Peptidase S8 pro-domain domain-containing protein n=1 Tax=Eschrichtius robustus TaxID=9764 RepID=A0AB34GV48_ESCRO|nr:hypothetical protein J1605_010278 [Eschrichtius robustus]
MGWGSRCCCPGRLDLLCVLALLGGCLLPVCRTRVYTNHWAVKIAGGFSEANRIASKYGFINLGQGGEGDGSALTADALVGLLRLHAPCLPCQDEERGRCRLGPLEQESTDGF